MPAIAPFLPYRADVAALVGADTKSPGLEWNPGDQTSEFTRCALIRLVEPHVRLLRAEHAARPRHAAVRQRGDRVADEVSIARHLLVDRPAVGRRIVDVDALDHAIRTVGERPHHLAVRRADTDLLVDDLRAIDRRRG